MNGNLSEIQAELIAIGAAVAAGCEPCLRTHVRQARAIGLTDAELRMAVAVARKVKETPARLILEAAERLLAQGTESPAPPSESGCCG
ncbi:MAG: carboxymuconolactone decarboxylase family protein [Rhodospirillales bacterium]|nr:carboxymuconolactone decarboxylase family protein [Rhodospirillales bacterium]MBI2978570.1 carboxymuconolactone decarboxylase family protein [Rhodospirillales bacterium]